MTDWKAWKMWKSCSRKVKFKHEGQARREAHKHGQRAYRCKYCDGWHLTSHSSPEQVPKNVTNEHA